MPKLAINGGPAVAPDLGRKIRWPLFDEEDRRILIEVLESGRWCRLYEGSWAERFERAFAEFHSARHGIAVANGTVALELALKTVGVGFGDEVIVPAVTFIATASAVAEVGGVPIFADIDPMTGNIDPRSVESAITDKTKAIIAVHYAGYPANLDEIISLARRYGLFVIEDCAHAHGSEWRGRRVGAIGDMGGFSFQESKALTAGEGGIVLTDSDELAERARLIHNIGRVVGKPGYIHYILSSNYRISEFQAALLYKKLLKDLPWVIEKRHSNGEYLAGGLEKIRGVEPVPRIRDPRVTKRGYYYFVMKYDPSEFHNLPKELFIAALNAEGIPAGVGYGMPLYRQPAFKKENLKGIFPREARVPDYEKLYLPNAEHFTAQQITLPHQILLLEKEDLDLIVAAIEKIRENIDELLSAKDRLLNRIKEEYRHLYYNV